MAGGEDRLDGQRTHVEMGAFLEGAGSRMIYGFQLARPDFGSGFPASCGRPPT
jgi:hypothetical protein